MWANAQDDENERRKAQVLHVFSVKEKHVSLVLFFYRPRMKSAQQVPHRLTVHTTSACCWELKTPRWAERRALLLAAILQGQGAATLKVRLRSLHFHEQRKMFR